MSAIAVFVALGGGTAVALNGSNTVVSNDIVNRQVKSQDLARSQRAVGALSATFVMRRADGPPWFGPASGLAMGWPDESMGFGASLSPNVPIVARDMAVRFGPYHFEERCFQQPCSVRVALRDDGADTPVQCVATSDQGCNSGTKSALIAPGSELTIRVDVLQGDFGGINAFIGWRAATR